MYMDTKTTPNQIHPSLVAKRHTTKESAVIEIYGQTEKLFCRMNNLSTSGAFFEIVSANFTPKKNQIIRMTVTLKQINKTYILHGEVVWAKGLGVGVSFIKQKDLLTRIVR